MGDKIKEWEEIQIKLSKEVIEKGEPSFKKIGGVDIHEIGEKAFCAIVILENDLTIWKNVIEVRLTESYLSSFLSFRQLDAILEIYKTVPDHLKPDILIIDGCGIHHPRYFGLACHVGLTLQIPTIGISKTLLYLQDWKQSEIRNEISEKGYSDLKIISPDGIKVVSRAITSKSSKNPIYISIGHMVSLDHAEKVARSVHIFRIPEPIRQADQLCRKACKDI